MRASVEFLEQRSLLSVSLVFGELRIATSESADSIKFTTSSQHPSLLQVRVNGKLKRFTFGDVRRIQIDSFGGDDQISIGDFRIRTRINSGEGSDAIVGGASVDSINGGPGNDTISGSGGDDRCWGDDGNDVLVGGFGDDLLSGELGDDVIRGEDGSDNLLGGYGSDSIWGGAATDWLFGDNGRDWLCGEAGNDVLIGYTNLDSIYGGTGTDVFDISDLSSELMDRRASESILPYTSTGRGPISNAIKTGRGSLVIAARTILGL